MVGSVIRDGMPEGALMAILAATGTLSVGYAFLSLAARLENWTAFQNYLEQLVR